MYLKKVIPITFSALLFLGSISSANATDECFEGISRSVFKFNMAFDNVILEPIAKGYNTIPNNILQGNFKELGNSFGSFAINSTVGIFGFLNPAEKLGLKPLKEDVGQTLGSYGIGQGCYYVLPILGPTTIRDSIGMIADTFVDPFAYVTIREKELLSISGNNIDYYSLKGTTAVDFRSDNLTNFESLEKNSIDLYSSMKSVYLQSRENKVGNSDGDQEDWDLDK